MKTKIIVYSLLTYIFTLAYSDDNERLQKFYKESSLDISKVSICWDDPDYEELEYYDHFDDVYSCLENKYQEIEQEMSLQYQSTIEQIVKLSRTMYFPNNNLPTPLVDTEQLELLIKSQKAWEYYRKQECSFSLSNSDDTDLSNPITKAEWFICMAVHANIRLESLRLHNVFRYPSATIRG